MIISGRRVRLEFVNNSLHARLSAEIGDSTGRVAPVTREQAELFGDFDSEEEELYMYPEGQPGAEQVEDAGPTREDVGKLNTNVDPPATGGVEDSQCFEFPSGSAPMRVTKGARVVDMQEVE